MFARDAQLRSRYAANASKLPSNNHSSIRHVHNIPMILIVLNDLIRLHAKMQDQLILSCFRTTLNPCVKILHKILDIT